MKKKSAVILAFILVFALSFCGAVIAFDGNDYGGGGGGGGGDSYYGGSGGSSQLDFSDPVDVTLLIVVIVVFIAAGVIGSKMKKRGGGIRSGQGSQGANVFLPNRNDQIQEIIRKKDPNFTADDFVTFAKQVYIDIQMAWCARDMSPVRPVMHQNLFNTTQRQVEEKIKQGVVYHYESIAINTAYLTSFVRDKDFEYLTVYLNARMIDYQVDEKTGNIIRGDKNTRWDMRYKMKFVRSTSATTKDAVSGTHGYNCPNCGAPLEITSSGECPYCGSTVTTGDYSWVLTDFTTVRNDTVDDGIRVPEDTE